MLNKVLLIGNLGDDPQMRFTEKGTGMASFSLATHYVRTDAAGERIKYTEWHRVVAWGKLAEICNSYLKKGRTVCVEGKLRTRTYQDKKGATNYITEVVADAVRFFGEAKPRDASSPQRHEGAKRGE